MKLIKLTDKNNVTHNSLTWGPGITHVVKKTDNPKLCSADVIHAYKHLDLAILLNPIGADYRPFRIWEAKGDIAVEDWGKAGCFKLTTIRELNIPKWFLDEDKRKKVLVYFAVLCTEKVLKTFEDSYPNNNRPRKAIEEARKYLDGTMTPRVDYAAHAAAGADNAARVVALATAHAYININFSELSDEAIKMYGL